MKAVQTILATSFIASTVAFAPSNKFSALTSTRLHESFDPLHLAESKVHEEAKSLKDISTAAAAAAATFALSPLAAFAEEADDYEYGAVNAPIGLAWGVGVLVIATALVPLALKGGEEAFEEMRQKDASTWGTGNSDRLNRRNK